jgi:FkbH-like protein
MQWLPLASDVNATLRAARAAVASERVERLAALAGHRLGYLEVLQVDRALREVWTDAPARFSRVRLALLGAATLEHLAPGIRVGGLRRGLLIDVRTGRYNQHRQELLDVDSEVHRFAPQVVVLSLTARQLVGQIPLVASASEVDAALDAPLAEVRQLWRHARERFGADIVQQSLLCVEPQVFGSFDRLVPGSPAQLVRRLNDRLAEAAAADGVHLLDLARIVAGEGLGAWFDPARWLQAKMEVAPPAAAWYGEHVARIVGAQRGCSRKCLVLDLDNTLWGGVVGDDGVAGLVLGEGSGAGEAHLALQRYAQQLGERGVILAVCSKNDPVVAEAAFREHPEMVLRPEDVAVFLANWDDKAENLRRIASHLNIGLESLVFVDDNPAERARIRQSLPMVAVPELPADVAGYVRCLADAGYFEAVAFTADDRERGRQYAANAARETLLESSESMDDYLRSLGMTLEASAFRAVDLVRVTQLINKTNQFNPTTRRYSQQEVAACLVDPCLTLQCRLADRFGDNGLVSALILRPADGEPGALEIDTWVMSCRVFGRQLEHAALNLAVEAARVRGARFLRARYAPTAKNGVVADLYPRLGFQPDPGRPAGAGETHWVLDLATYTPWLTHIAFTGD